MGHFFFREISGLQPPTADGRPPTAFRTTMNAAVAERFEALEGELCRLRRRSRWQSALFCFLCLFGGVAFGPSRVVQILSSDARESESNFPTAPNAGAEPERRAAAASISSPPPRRRPLAAPDPTPAPTWSAWVALPDGPGARMSLAVGSGQSLAGLGGWDMMYGGGVETYVDGNTADFYGYSAATSGSGRLCRRCRYVDVGVFSSCLVGPAMSGVLLCDS